MSTNLPPAETQRPVLLSQMWGFAESQETVGISPDMFAEFILPYQLPLLKRFGLNYYGCCEPLEKRFKHVRSIPRLRRVSVAPMANQEAMADLLGRDYVYCRKANPVPVCVGFNEDHIREDVRRTLRAAGDLVLEIILKDTHTVQNDPTRLGQWVNIARQEIERYSPGLGG